MEWDIIDAKLYPNIKGCGYPPSINCTLFNKNYSTPGRTFPCYYSKEQPLLVLTGVDIEGIKKDLIYAIIIPWGCFLVSVLYLLLTYAGMRKPDAEGDQPQEVSSAKASKEASNYSLRSIGKTINQGMNKLRGEPDDKGGHGGGNGGGVLSGFKRGQLTSHSMLGPKLLLAPASLPQVHPTRRTTLPPLERTPPLPRPARMHLIRDTLIRSDIGAKFLQEDELMAKMVFEDSEDDGEDEDGEDCTVFEMVKIALASKDKGRRERQVRKTTINEGKEDGVKNGSDGEEVVMEEVIEWKTMEYTDVKERKMKKRAGILKVLTTVFYPSQAKHPDNKDTESQVL
ncbi:tipE-like, partial [Homarus americanus]